MTPKPNHGTLDFKVGVWDKGTQSYSLSTDKLAEIDSISCFQTQ